MDSERTWVDCGIYRRLGRGKAHSNRVCVVSRRHISGHHEGHEQLQLHWHLIRRAFDGDGARKAALHTQRYTYERQTGGHAGGGDPPAAARHYEVHVGWERRILRDPRRSTGAHISGWK